MSKSLGNGIDPLEVIEKYGADALRLMLTSGNSAGNDLRFYWEKIEANRNFLNKIWNATRFILMNIEDEDLSNISLDNLTDTDKWILSKCNTLAKEVTQNLESYDLGVALSKIYDFIWDEYCDWYIEMVKPRLYNKEDETRKSALYTLKTVLINSLKLLHPFAPFVTEEIFTSIQDKEETIMLSKWPEFKEELNFIKEEEKIELIKTAIKGIRNIRSEMNVPNSKKAQIIISSNNDLVNDTFKTSEVFFKTLAFASDIIIKEHKNAPEGALSVVIPNGVLYMPFDELVDIEKELDRLNKEKEKLIKEVERVEKKLSNEGFVSKAPERVILEEKEKMNKYKDMLEKVKEQIKSLKK